MTISLLVEIPESLQSALADFLENDPAWDQDRAFTAAMALFLLQRGGGNREASRIYLDALFGKQAQTTCE